MAIPLYVMMVVSISWYPNKITRLIALDEIEDIILDHLTVLFTGTWFGVRMKWKGIPDSINNISDLSVGELIDFSVSYYVKWKCFVIVEFSFIVLEKHRLTSDALLPRISKA